MNSKKQKRRQGFTIMEMLIVVAIIAVLAAIAIPTFSSSLHKAKVAADEANVRAYFADLQTRYLTTGEYDTSIPTSITYDFKTEIVFSDGSTTKLQAGFYVPLRPDNKGIALGNSGYQILYQCNEGDCSVVFGGKNWKKV